MSNPHSHINIGAQVIKLKAQRDELVTLLKEAQRLGLNFDCGNAYIRRVYVDRQDALNDRIKLLFDEIKSES